MRGGDSKDLECEGLSAWYGSTLLYSSDGETTLTLSPVSATSFPTSVWIEVVESKNVFCQVIFGGQLTAALVLILLVVDLVL